MAKTRQRLSGPFSYSPDGFIRPRGEHFSRFHLKDNMPAIHAALQQWRALCHTEALFLGTHTPLWELTHGKSWLSLQYAASFQFLKNPFDVENVLNNAYLHAIPSSDSLEEAETLLNKSEIFEKSSWGKVDLDLRQRNSWRKFIKGRPITPEAEITPEIFQQALGAPAKTSFSERAVHEIADKGTTFLNGYRKQLNIALS